TPGLCPLLYRLVPALNVPPTERLKQRPCRSWPIAMPRDACVRTAPSAAVTGRRHALPWQRSIVGHSAHRPAPAEGPMAVGGPVKPASATIFPARLRVAQAAFLAAACAPK